MHFEQGFSIIEVVASLLMVALISLGVMKSSLLSHKTVNLNQLEAVANQLAVEKLEEFAGIDPINISTADNSTETNLQRKNTTFSRVVQVSINSDQSRTVLVTVTGNLSILNVNQSVSSTFSVWGNK